MKNMLRIELRKAFQNKFFFIGLATASLLAVLSAVYNIQTVAQEMQVSEGIRQSYSGLINPHMPLYSLFNHWLCEDFNSLSGSLFFFIYPLISVMPYGWSLFEERKSGYIKNVVCRTRKANYFFSKYIAVFLSGGAVVAVPAALNFLITSMFIPAIKPDVFYDIGWTVREASMFSECFFKAPFLYVLLRILLLFAFGGAISSVGFALAFSVNNRFAVVLLPFLGTLALHYGQNIFSAATAPELSPIYTVSANGFKTKTLPAAVLEILLVTAAVLFLTLKKGVKSDVF